MSYVTLPVIALSAVLVAPTAIGQEMAVLDADAHIDVAAFLQDGQTLMGKLSGGSVHFWDIAAGKRTGKLDSSRSDGSSVSQSPDGRLMAVGGLEGGIVGVWREGDRMPSIRLPGHMVWGSALAFSQDSRWLVTGDRAGNVLLWDTEEWAQRASWQFQSEFAVEGVAMMADGRVASRHSRYGHGGIILIWDIGHVNHWLTIRYPQGELLQMAGSEDGRILAASATGASGSAPGVRLLLWDTATWQKREVNLPLGNPRHFALSRDGTQAALSVCYLTKRPDYSGEFDVRDTLQIIDLESERILADVPGRFRALAFSPDGAKLVASIDHELRLYDVPAMIAAHDDLIIETNVDQ